MVDRSILERRLRALEDFEHKIEGFVTIPEQEFLVNEAVHDLWLERLEQPTSGGPPADSGKTRNSSVRI